MVLYGILKDIATHSGNILYLRLMNDQKKSLRTNFNKLEAIKAELLASLDGIPDKDLNFVPVPGSWSLGQVLYHLWLVESLSLQYMKKKTAGTPAPDNTSLTEGFRMIMMKIALASPVKFKAPRVTSESIPEQVDYDHLAKEWQATRRELASFIDDLSPELIRHRIFRHPRVGMINIIQSMEFFVSHFRHHLPQINNLLSKIKAQQELR